MIAEKELLIIEKQLGRRPRGVRAIETRCPAGHPQVIKVSPLVDDKPFPTLFWLTCPSLNTQISRLEHEGNIQIVEALIREDSEFQEAYHQNHQRYAEERWSQLSTLEKVWIESHGYADALLKTGIGGIHDWDTVKCLHLHYAHHLARGNVIGEWIDKHFEIAQCS